MKTLKSILSLIFVVAVLLFIPITASAATGGGSCGTNVTWELTSDGTLTISGTGAMTDYSSNSSVPWYSYRSSISQVVIHDGVTSIGSRAFYNCTSLTSITIPDSVTSIGDYAFYKCTGLTSITIPDSVTSIGNSAFENCTTLTSITIPDSVTSIGDYAFYDCSSLTSITIPDSVTSIGSSTFQGCYRLTNITIPDSVTSIDRSAFYGCTSLTSITIPDSVTSIGDHAFSSCNSLTSVYITDLKAWCKISFSDYNSNPLSNGAAWYINGVEASEIIIPDEITEIGSYAFYNCSSLTSITIPASVTSIGYSAFYKCTGLTSITIPDSVTSIGSSAFAYCTGLTAITIPDSVTSIDSRAFSYCTGLTSITIPASVTSIGDYAFQRCSSLTNITIPDSVTSIDRSAFYGCTSLTSITIPDSVTSIGGYAFYNCTGLTSITIGNGMTSIGDYAFSGCSSLTSITIPDSVTSIGNYVFENCTGLTSVYITDLKAWCEISFSYYDSNPLSNGAALYINGVEASEIIIPDETTEIGSRAFYNCTGLTSVTIPDSVTSIGSRAFYNCTGLTSVTIPDSVTSIGHYAFYNCTGLTSVYITDLKAWCEISFSYYDSNPLFNGAALYINGVEASEIIIPNETTEIGDYAFYKCTSLTSITIPDSVTSIGDDAFYKCTSLTAITIPDSVTSIGNAAFRGCSSLTSITIPDSVTSIGSYVFYDCTGLTSITFECSAPPSIGSYAFYDVVATVYYLNRDTWTTDARQNYGGTITWVPYCLHSNTVTETVGVTCTQNGTLTVTCSDCGEIISTQTVPAAHAWGNWTQLKAATCTTDGLRIRKCTACNAAEQERLPAFGHTNTAVVTAPTCTEPGYTTNTCAVCGEVTITDEVVALGHAYTAVTTEPTCTAEGSTVKTCSVCGDTVTEVLPAKGHDWSDWIVLTDATCTADGEQVHLCDCGEVEYGAIPKLGHSFTDGVCTNCQAQLPEITGSSLTLGSTLRLDITLKLVGIEQAACTVRATIGKDEKQQIMTGGCAVLIPAHRLHEAVTIELLYDGQVVDTEIWTMEDYAASLRQDYADDTEMMNLLDALSDYSTYADYYADLTGTAPKVEAVESVTKAQLEGFKNSIQISGAELKPVAALYLDDACHIRVKFDAAAWGDNKLLINGGEVSVTEQDGKMVYVIAELIPQQWDDMYNIQVVSADDTVLFSVDYCVLSYAYDALSRSQEAQAGLNNLLKAMYLYHQAANAYIAK